MYLYRVDSIESLRSIRNGTLCAWNWCCEPAATRRPHKPLTKLLPSLPEGNGIFRICFWSAEADARSDLYMRSLPESRHGLLRIPKADVQRAFDGWTEAEDDLIGPHARMYWTTQPVQKEVEDFSREGIPLEAIEHWVQDVGWVSLAHSPALLPESTRMARLGLYPVMYSGLAGTPCLAYWKTFLLDKPSGAREAIILLRHARIGQTALQNVGEELDGVAEAILSSLGRSPQDALRFVVATGQGRSIATSAYTVQRGNRPAPASWLRRLWESMGRHACTQCDAPVHLLPSGSLTPAERELVIAELGLRLDLS